MFPIEFLYGRSSEISSMEMVYQKDHNSSNNQGINLSNQNSFEEKFYLALLDTIDAVFIFLIQALAFHI